MKKNFSEKLKNALEISMDYVAFTVTTYNSWVLLVRDLGFHEDDFIEMPKGANGYKKQVKHTECNLSVLFDGQDNMGIHLNASGSAVAPLLEAFHKHHKDSLPDANMTEQDVFAFFCKTITDNGHFTRLDIAIDDIGKKYYAPSDVFSRYEENRIVSKWRTVRREESRNAPQSCTGYTLYFGSRESDLMLRIYDKKLEQNKKRKPDADDYVDYEWTRWELEFKGERADELASTMIDGHSLSTVAISVLGYYFRIINLDDSNKSRCTCEDKWSDFISELKQLRLHNKKKEKTIFDKAIWIEEQCAPTMFLLLVMADDTDALLNEIAMRNKHRLSKADKDMLKAERPDKYEEFFGDN